MDSRQRKIISKRAAAAWLGVSVVTIYRLEKSGKLPGRVQISEGRVGFFEDEINDYIESRPRVQATPQSA